MPTIQKNARLRKQKHIKRKELYRNQINLGNPQVFLQHEQSQQNHELLSDWEAAS